MRTKRISPSELKAGDTVVVRDPRALFMPFGTPEYYLYEVLKVNFDVDKYHIQLLRLISKMEVEWELEDLNYKIEIIRDGK